MTISAMPLLLLLLVSLSVGSCVGDHHQLLNFMTVKTSSLKHIAEGAVCSGHKVTMPSGDGVRWVPMNRPHGPCSSAAATTVVDGMLLWDQLRTSSIRRKLSGGRAGDGLPVIHSREAKTSNIDSSMTAKGTLGGGGGTSSTTMERTSEHYYSKVSQTVVVDTSSDIPWVQCLPCPAPQCHLQKDQLYDPANSSTYAPIPCGSPACAELGSSHSSGCSAGSDQCKYILDYGDGRATAGTYVTDTLTLSPTIAVKGFRFGCSHAVRGTFSDQTAGVLALGGGAGSLLAQTAEAFGNAFSYCVPHPSSDGFLSLGGPVGNSSQFASTPLNKNQHAPTFYIVRLEAITVAGRRLDVLPATFAGGAVMDSGAVVTQLPPSAYAALRAAFRSAMTAYGPLADPIRNLDTCYDLTRFPEVNVPKVSLVFAGGATLELEPASIMLDGCLAFTASPGGHGSIGFIGNVQQQTYEVLYDVGSGSVGFRRGAC
ncbi:hypothetical protein ACQJBY_062061 [Aegilops geniculata]